MKVIVLKNNHLETKCNFILLGEQNVVISFLSFHL